MRRAVIVLAVAVIGVISAVPAGAGVSGELATSTPAWAPAATATVHPGVQTVTGSNQCTANFVFFDSTHIYIGQAAHCAGTDGNMATNGCTAGVMPVGTSVTIRGATRAGTLVYSSWSRMRQLGESNGNACRGNDFALVRIDPADHGRVNPSVPFWGGPSGLASGSTFGERLYGYGNSGLWLGIDPLQPKQGIGLGPQEAGWSHGAYTAPPGVPGDSGSAYLNGSGRALGVLSTLEVAPEAGSNNLSDLRKALEYMRDNTSLSVTLANGTVPFSG